MKYRINYGMSSRSLPPLLSTYRTKSILVYETLKAAILSGSLPPGERLKVKALSESLGVSQTPVREALRLLAKEGLVVIRLHSDACVADLPVEGVEENLLIRAELEALATRVASEHIPDDVLQELEALCAQMDDCVRAGNGERYGELNRRFHLAIYRCIPYKRLYGLIEELWNQVPRARWVFVLAPHYMAQSQAGHRKIVEALRARDGERAAEIVRDQKRTARELLSAQRNANAPR